MCSMLGMDSRWQVVEDGRLERCVCCGGDRLVELDDEISCLTCWATIPVANVVRWERVDGDPSPAALRCVE